MHVTTLKGSNCGAEVSNLTLGWSKRQWLWSLLPALALGIYFYWLHSTLFRHRWADRNDIEVKLLDVRADTNSVDVIGKLRNNGESTWERVTVEAEFFDDQGRFLNEVTQYLRTPLGPNAEEHFRLTLHSSDPAIVEGKAKTVLKISDASASRF